MMRLAILMLCLLLNLYADEITPRQMIDNAENASFTAIDCDKKDVYQKVINDYSSAMQLYTEDMMDYDVSIDSIKRISGDFSMCAILLKHTIIFNADSLGISKDSDNYKLATDMALTEMKDTLGANFKRFFIDKDDDNNIIMYEYLEYISLVDNKGNIKIFLNNI